MNLACPHLTFKRSARNNDNNRRNNDKENKPDFFQLALKHSQYIDQKHQINRNKPRKLKERYKYLPIVVNYLVFYL